MRLIVGISLMLLGVGILSCQVEGTSRATLGGPPAAAWVRTNDGWERPVTWYSMPPARPTLHPLVVAAGQGLASVFALVALGREPK